MKTILAISSILILTACGGSGSPESVAQEYLDAIQEGDRARAEETLCLVSGFWDGIEVTGVASAELGEPVYSDEVGEADATFPFTFTIRGMAPGTQATGEIQVDEAPFELAQEVNKMLAEFGATPAELNPEDFREGPCIVLVTNEPN